MLNPNFVKLWLPTNETSSNIFDATEKMDCLGSVKDFTELSAKQLPDIEIVIARIEAAQIDITAQYKDWIKTGFAFAHELGEEGREYFHRVSRFYPQYSRQNCDNQYTQCLHAKDKRTTIKSFYYLAQQAGIDIICGETTPANVETVTVDVQPVLKAQSAELTEEAIIETQPLFNTPLLPPEVYDHLPGLLRECCDLFTEGIEKDVFLISALTVASACVPKIEGIYFDEPYSAHLYLFITAPAGSGKGKMKWAKYLGLAIHEKMAEQSGKERAAYEVEMEKYDNLAKIQKQGIEKPKEPKRKMFFIPANSSTSAFIQTMADNGFSGIIFETEGDTMANTAKQEWGDTSDVFRKAFHHEATSLNRRKDNEYIEIKNPHLAIALSGTPRQVQRLMPDVEDGLFSRYMYYAFEDKGGFKNPFVSHTSTNLPEFFTHKGLAILELYEQLQNLDQPITFKLTEAQGVMFTEFFNTMLHKDKLLLGSDFDANVKRLGLITFRLAMVISALRILDDGDISNPMVCSDQDYETAISIATTLEQHAIAVFNNMPNNGLKGKKLAYYDKLPQQFDRQTYLKVAKELSIEEKSAEKYISLFKQKLLNHEHNLYTKITK